MSRDIPRLGSAWRILALLLTVVVAGEAWYLGTLSDTINDQRIAQSMALERHLSDEYAIAKLKREAASKAHDAHDCVKAQ